ncbi:hypothetical protein PhCBS80983_g02253 [Powellomyces hirtus]|uniref:Gag1-like clamp domain-containing protein n=1 Tax=Powellomyces hirtus TaxID=109895 RepID=A0A507E7Z9_9FUNG|nr:hypothetical protein PhCBS80983_g02253 [Powellomyces hirtus]
MSDAGPGSTSSKDTIAADQSQSETAAPTRITTGLSHWEQRRAAWIQGHKPYTQNPAPAADDWCKDNPALAEVDSTHFDAIYRSLVDGRRFAKAVPLPFVVAVLVHGWKKEGLWSPATGIGSAYPNEQPERSSNNNDWDPTKG